MEFRTIVEIEKPSFQIEPMEQMLFVGSCFAANIGQRFVDNKFRAIVNPFGVMYNPASILHTVERLFGGEESFVPRVVFFTLGTNRVYRLKETGEIVDNCQKRPARLFREEELTVDECADYILKAARILASVNPEVRIVLTVSPIRYAKYGYHQSQLSKATLLLAAHNCITNLSSLPSSSCRLNYFPSYEIVNDELRDYRFYREDMLHPTDQAVEYIWQRLQETYFSPAALRWLDEWKPVREALNHRPFNPDSSEYKSFIEKTHQRIADLKVRYPELEV
ncbi:MAG: GSCFA domain-containing protein [Prevotella sp.]